MGHAGTMVGSYWIVACGKGNPTTGTRGIEGDLTCGRFVVIDVADPEAPKVVTEKNVLGGTADLPRDLYYDTYLAPLGHKIRFTGCYRGIVGWWGMRNSGVAASGNRMFMQSATHLYCIGDPTVKYDWNPNSRPERITEGLNNP